MKAAVVISKGILEVMDVPVPEIGPYDALCRMEFGATCAGTDIHLTDGKHPFPVFFPTILGHESIGRVMSVGSKVRNYKEGDLITRVGCPALSEAGINSNWGGFAEYGVARDHKAMKEDGVPRTEWDKSRVNQVVLPGIDVKTAPMIITWRETLSYVHRIGVTKDSSVLVFGSGANALSLAAHCRNLGAAVTAVGSSSRRGSFRAIGVTDYLDYKSEDLRGDLGRCNDGRYDFIIDGVGNSDTVNKALDLLAENATIGVYGWNDRTGYGINPFLAKSSFRVYCDGYDEEETNDEVQQMILDCRLRAEPWYDMDNPVPLRRITDAYQSLRKHEALKYLIKLQED